MPRIFEKRVFLAAFLFAILIIAATSAAAEQEIFAGANDIAITADMAGKTLEAVKGTCNLIIGAFTYKPAAKKMAPLYIRGTSSKPPYSPIIPIDAMGKGLRVVSAKDCKLATTSGFAPFLNKASRLVSGWNLISVSGGMAGKSLNDAKGTCSVQKARIYSEAACAAALRNDPQSDSSAAEKCDGDFIIIEPDKPIDSYYKGRGLWVEVESDCTLDDGTPAEALCSEAECAAKSGCTGGEYVTYGCKEKECMPLSTKECSAEEKADAAAKAGVNLVPVLAVSPSEGVKSGDTIQVTLSVKNAGDKSTKDPSVLSKCTGQNRLNCFSFHSLVRFYKKEESGAEALPALKATVDLVANEIKPQGSLELVSQRVKVPDDFSGNLLVVAVVDPQQAYPEADGGKDDNRKPVLLTVRAASLPNLVPESAEASPLIEKFPAKVYGVKVTVKNTGEMPAVADKQFLENKVSLLKGNTEVCSGARRDLVTIAPGESHDFVITVKAPADLPCIINDKDATYWAVVDVDTLQPGIDDSKNRNDNKKTFQIKGPQKCAPVGARQAGKYCSIEAVWLTQTMDGEQCSNNFECKTDMCIRGGCVTESQKKDILKILGIG